MIHGVRTTEVVHGIFRDSHSGQMHCQASQKGKTAIKRQFTSSESPGPGKSKSFEIPGNPMCWIKTCAQLLKRKNLGNLQLPRFYFLTIEGIAFRGLSTIVNGRDISVTIISGNRHRHGCVIHCYRCDLLNRCHRIGKCSTRCIVRGHPLRPGRFGYRRVIRCHWYRCHSRNHGSVARSQAQQSASNRNQRNGWCRCIISRNDLGTCVLQPGQKKHCSSDGHGKCYF